MFNVATHFNKKKKNEQDNLILNIIPNDNDNINIDEYKKIISLENDSSSQIESKSKSLQTS